MIKTVIFGRSQFFDLLSDSSLVLSSIDALRYYGELHAWIVIQLKFNDHRDAVETT